MRAFAITSVGTQTLEIAPVKAAAVKPQRFYDATCKFLARRRQILSHLVTRQ